LIYFVRLMDYQLGIIGLIAVVLLIIDRYVRIESILKGNRVVTEGFKLNTGTGSKKTGRRCGVDLSPCASNLRCGNGMCISQNETMPVEANPLEVRA